jgi:hypothetical protein
MELLGNDGVEAKPAHFRKMSQNDQGDDHARFKWRAVPRPALLGLSFSFVSAIAELRDISACLCVLPLTSWCHSAEAGISPLVLHFFSSKLCK